jgi:hypothetical protein
MAERRNTNLLPRRYNVLSIVELQQIKRTKKRAKDWYTIGLSARPSSSGLCYNRSFK